MIFKNYSSNKLIGLGQLIFLSLLTFMILNEQASAEDLNKLQQQIEKSKQTKAQTQKQQQLLENELVQSEQTIAKASLEVIETKKSIDVKRAILIELQKKSAQLKKEKQLQQTLLQQQLVSAYMTGQNDLIKLILNQEDLSRVIRAKSYYHYLNEARLESIESLHNTQKELESNEAKQITNLTLLETLYKEQKQTEKKVNDQKLKRNKALRKLNQDINYQTSKLAELSDLQKKLSERIKKAAQERKKRELAAAKREASKKKAEKQKQALAEVKKQASKKTLEKQKNLSLVKQKGALAWPIKGRVLHTFASQRSSQVKWKGIVISANEGERVRAVATGSVLFSGYFKGYGMVIALDHHDNYITLYGYNQTLLHKTGDVVFKGDAIAIAGHSGGQEINSLYFELSYKGKAENPLNWLSRKSK